MSNFISILPDTIILEYICSYLTGSEAASLKSTNLFFSKAKFPEDVDLLLKMEIINGKLINVLNRLDSYKNEYHNKFQILQYIEERESGTYTTRICFVFSSIMSNRYPSRVQLRQEMLNLRQLRKETHEEKKRLKLELTEKSTLLQDIKEVTEISKYNRDKFDRLRKINLCLGKYAIIGNGQHGMYNIRKLDEILIVVSTSLQNALLKTYKTGVLDGINVIVLDKDIYVLVPHPSRKEKGKVAFDRIIANAETIKGLAFQNYEDWMTEMGQL